MDPKTLPKLKIGKLEAEIPIIQGGMSVGISLSGLASAVANEGGIGVIGAAGLGLLESDSTNNFRQKNENLLRREIRYAKERTDGIIGVNIMIALSDHINLMNAAIDEGIDIIFIGAGTLLRAPDEFDMQRLKESSTAIVPIVSSPRSAMVMCKFWSKNYGFVPDGIVMEGPKAGGHIGFATADLENPEYSLENILPEVIEAVKPFEKEFGSIPVIAAGGIYTGADIYKFLQMGAFGVQMGTRFVATHECDASEKFKEMYINSTEEDMIIINSPVGMPGRAIRNEFIDDVSAGKKKPFSCSWKCLRTCDFKESPYCIALALKNAREGKLDEGFAFAGKNAYRTKEIISVKELIDTLKKEYKEAF